MSPAQRRRLLGIRWPVVVASVLVLSVAVVATAWAMRQAAPPEARELAFLLAALGALVPGIMKSIEIGLRIRSPGNNADSGKLYRMLDERLDAMRDDLREDFRSALQAVQATTEMQLLRDEVRRLREGGR